MSNVKYLIVDGVTYKVPIVELKRKADILDLNATRTQDGNLHREVIGTFYNYTLNIGVVNDWNTYNALFDVLSEPKASHTVTLPHQSTSFEGYFSSIQDNIVLVTDEGFKAKGLSCNLTMTKPARRPT